MITGPQAVIIVMNGVLYILTWLKVRNQQSTLKSLPGYEKRVRKRSYETAKNMIMMILAFLIQWLLPSVYGLWRALDIPTPLSLYYGVVISSNMSYFEWNI